MVAGFANTDPYQNLLNYPYTLPLDRNVPREHLYLIFVFFFFCGVGGGGGGGGGGRGQIKNWTWEILITKRYF